MEEWKQSEDFPSYDISSEGKVRNRKTGKILKTYVDGKGYEKVCLSKSGKQNTKKIHTLVADTFYNKSDSNLEAYHADGNKLNNSVDNIKIGTHAEVIKNAYATGNIKSNRRIVVKVVETGEVYESIEECSKAIGVNPSTISKCLNYPECYNNRKGLHFEYAD